MRILSANQPAYLPWLGYFDKIKKSDVYVYMDDVQFEKNSFTNRNQIKTATGPLWLTIPVHIKNHFEETVSSTYIFRIDDCWKTKHLKTIELFYNKAPYFKIYFPFVESLILTLDTQHCTSISDFCWDNLEKFLSNLNLCETEIIKSSSLGLEQSKSARILEMCQKLNADIYLAGILAKDYLIEEEFKKAGIKIIYQNYTYYEYPQLWGKFMPNLSIIDFLMNVGNPKLI